MDSHSHTGCMVYLLVTGILAFFTLAGLCGADSRQYEPRARRWL